MKDIETSPTLSQQIIFFLQLPRKDLAGDNEAQSIGEGNQPTSLPHWNAFR